MLIAPQQFPGSVQTFIAKGACSGLCDPFRITWQRYALSQVPPSFLKFSHTCDMLSRFLLHRIVSYVVLIYLYRAITVAVRTEVWRREWSTLSWNMATSILATACVWSSHPWLIAATGLFDGFSMTFGFKPDLTVSGLSNNKKAQLMLAYPRDAKMMKKIPPFRSYNKFQSSRKSGVYSN